MNIKQTTLSRTFPKIPPEFYTHPKVDEIARLLLGKLLVTQNESKITSGIIVETEAYSGRNDKACHANNGKRTPRTEVFYLSGGLPMYI